MMWVLAAVLLLQACSRPVVTQELRFVGHTMGGSWSVIAHSPYEPVDPKMLSESLGELLGTLDHRLSNWVDDSEVSRFNRATPSTWVPVSADTVAVVQAAMDVSARSGGAFDVTLGPLVDTWGFGPGGRRASAPPDRMVSGAGGLAGMTRLQVRQSPPALMKSVRGLGLDLGGIAKGYAVDRVVALLRQMGFTGYLVEIGGEVRAVGERPGGGHWRVALESPPDSGAAPVIRLRDQAVATSGTYRNFFESDGQRYSHIIDPWHKYPVTHTLAAASVMAETAMLADAWATAMMVRGPEYARDLALEQQLAVFLQYRNAADTGWDTWASPAWEALVPPPTPGATGDP